MAADAAEPAPPAGGATRSPVSCGELFRVFQRLALQGFGGVLPVAHRELVERERWLSPEEFVELLALSQVLPGPNIVNLALIFGDRHFGWRGALAGTAGLMAVPMLIVLVLAALFRQFSTQPLVLGALRGMGAVAAGLVVGTAIKLSAPLKKNVMGQVLGGLIGLATFASVGIFRVPLVWVVLGIGGIAMAIAWRKLARAERGQP